MTPDSRPNEPLSATAAENLERIQEERTLPLEGQPGTDSLTVRRQERAEQWFVLRDLKRAGALRPAYLSLREEGLEVFTPMRWRVRHKGARGERVEVPVVQDLLFVHTSRLRLDPVIALVPTLQYRYLRGAGYRQPMTVRLAEMERFIRAVQGAQEVRYYLPGELTPDMVGRMVRLSGGPMDGCEGHLLALRGSRKKRLLVELPSLLSAAVEVNPEFVQLI